MTSPTHHERIDADFSRQVLEDLYAYRRKRRLVAWLWWATLGWFGAHRFYLNRVFTGLAMFFTLGGALFWWLYDATRIGAMVNAYNAEQARREKLGLPPIDLAFMPALDDPTLGATPPWIQRWNAFGSGRRVSRLAGDLLVLYIAGFALGRLAGVNGVPEAIAAVVCLAGVTVLGAGPPWLHELPVIRDFVAWSHRLRLFYYHNAPGSPPALLVRSVLGMLWAPFRSRNRAEVRMYAELGAVFTGLFLLMDIVSDVLVPLVWPGQSFHLESLIGGWAKQALMTFFATYAFAAPIGAILTLYLLTRRTHTVPRLLSVWVLVAILLGVVK